MELNNEFKRTKENILNNFYPFEYLINKKSFQKGNYKFLVKILIPTILTLGLLEYYTLNSTNKNNLDFYQSNNLIKIFEKSLNYSKLEKMLNNSK